MSKEMNLYKNMKYVMEDSSIDFYFYLSTFYKMLTTLHFV